MPEYLPDTEFTNGVMTEVLRLHQVREKRRDMAERLIQRLPVRTALSMAALLCAGINIVRLCFVLLSPVICK